MTSQGFRCSVDWGEKMVRGRKMRSEENERSDNAGVLAHTYADAQ